MKQLDFTNGHGSRKTPFKVPEHYFEDFATHLMEQIPEETKPSNVIPIQPKVTLLTRIKPYLYLAATICGLYFGIQVFKYQENRLSQKEDATATVTPKAAEQYVDDVCDFTMVNDQEVYACVTEND